MSALFSALIPISIAVVFAVLAVGIYTMFKGGDVSRTWSNKMMRLRVVAQFAAILVLCGALYYKTHFGN